MLVALVPYFLECHGSDDKVPVSGDAGSGGLEVCLLHLHCLPYFLTPVPLTLHLQHITPTQSLLYYLLDHVEGQLDKWPFV